jgi:hypothetical protein
MSNVRWARIGFALLAWLFSVLALGQVYLAGTAVQQLGGTNDFGTHATMGFIAMIVALVQLVLSFAGKLTWRMIGASAVLLGLMVVQSALVRLNTPGLAALHPLNGFLIAALSLWLAWQGLSIIRAPLPPEPVKVIPATAPAARPTLDQQDEAEDRL